MSIEIKTPAFPESISEGEIATWNFAEGDAISEGDIIVEVETDKVVMEVPAIKSGVMGKILKKEGFIRDFRVFEEEGATQKTLKINLLYREDKESAITGLKRVSKPGLRIYVGRHEVPRFYYGLGISIISTPKGLMTGQDSWRAGIGGEVICYVW